MILDVAPKAFVFGNECFVRRRRRRERRSAGITPEHVQPLEAAGIVVEVIERK